MCPKKVVLLYLLYSSFLKNVAYILLLIVVWSIFTNFSKEYLYFILKREYIIYNTFRKGVVFIYFILEVVWRI